VEGTGEKAPPYLSLDVRRDADNSPSFSAGPSFGLTPQDGTPCRAAAPGVGPTGGHGAESPPDLGLAFHTSYAQFGRPLEYAQRAPFLMGAMLPPSNVRHFLELTAGRHSYQWAIVSPVERQYDLVGVERSMKMGQAPVPTLAAICDPVAVIAPSRRTVRTVHSIISP